MEPQTFTVGETGSLNPNTFTRPGYHFTGWNTMEDGTGMSVPNEYSGEIPATSDITLYAQWELHSFADWIQTTVPTCTEAGEETHTCSVCGEVEIRFISALGHDLVHHESKDASCTEIGWDAYDTCSRCDYSTYVEIPALGHDFDYENIIWTWANDFSTATATFNCKRNSEHTVTVDATIEKIIETVTTIYVGTAIGPDGNDYTDRQETATNYTITWKNYNGETIKTTEVPYGTVPEFEGDSPVKASDSTYDYVHAGWYPALVAVTGEATYTAEFAAVTPDVETIDETLKFNAHTIALYNDLSIIYKINAIQLEGCTDPYIVCTINNKAYRIDCVRTSNDGNDRYWFELNNILPQQAATTVYTVLFATRGGETVKSVIDEYSIRKYCYNILNSETFAADIYTELRTLLVDLVNYAATAQEYINYRVEDLCNAFLTEEQSNMATQETPELTDRLATTDIESPTVQFTGLTLRLDEAVSIRYSFTADSIDGLVPVFTNSYGKSSTGSFIENTSTQTVENDYYIYFGDYNFSHLDNPVTLTIYNAEGEPASSTVTFSVNSYLCGHVNDSNIKLANICIALAKLGTSANAFVT